MILIKSSPVAHVAQVFLASPTRRPQTIQNFQSTPKAALALLSLAAPVAGSHGCARWGRPRLLEVWAPGGDAGRLGISDRIAWAPRRLSDIIHLPVYLCSLINGWACLFACLPSLLVVLRCSESIGHPVDSFILSLSLSLSLARHAMTKAFSNWWPLYTHPTSNLYLPISSHEV